MFNVSSALSWHTVLTNNKLYFLLILSHAWKFYSNPCTDHDKKKHILVSLKFKSFFRIEVIVWGADKFVTDTILYLC